MTCSPVIVVEPQCVGFQHVQFNAALLATLQCACGSAPIEFWAEDVHGAMTAERLAQPSGAISVRELGVSWSSVEWIRLRQEMELCRRAVARARSAGAKCVVFSSVSAPGLIALKKCLNRTSPEMSVLAFAHSILADAVKRPRRIWNYPLSIQAALRMATPAPLKLIALSASGASAANRICPGADIDSLDHPYLFTPRSQISVAPSGRRRTVRVGILGAVRTGLREICALIAAVRQRTGDVDFEVVGHVAPHVDGRADLLRLLPDTPESLLDYATYSSRLSALDYVLVVPDQAQHRFAASCTILDAFDHGKPGIFLNSPLLEEYRSKIGDFGIFCDDARRIADAVVAVAQQFPEVQYRAQVEAILAGRSLFAPSRVAAGLRRMLPC